MLWCDNSVVGLRLDHYDVRNLFSDYATIESFAATPPLQSLQNNVKAEKKGERGSGGDETDSTFQEATKKNKRPRTQDITEALCDLERYLSLPPHDWDVLAEGKMVSTIS